MFTSEEWTQNKLSKEAKGKEATKTVLTPRFWKNVVFILKVMAPLVRVLRLVDGDKKPPMATFMKQWRRQRKQSRSLSKRKKTSTKKCSPSLIVGGIANSINHCAAGHFLNPEIFYDRQQQLEFDLEVSIGLYACISLKDIDECNEWLVGEMDEDRVFDDDTLLWNTVYEASEVGEPRTYTRRSTGKRKEPSSGFSCARAKKSTTTRSTPTTSRSKGKVVEDDDELEEDYEVDDYDDEEPRDLVDEPSEGEEEEGFASLDENEDKEDDYVGIDEEED